MFFLTIFPHITTKNIIRLTLTETGNDDGSYETLDYGNDNSGANTMTVELKSACTCDAATKIRKISHGDVSKTQNRPRQLQ